MTEMVNRVAYAIGQASDCHLTPENMTRLARAAIEAMREVTKEMVLAGDTELENCTDSSTGSDADGNTHEYSWVHSDAPAKIWAAMIDASLARAA
jgi:hypothetical protein